MKRRVVETAALILALAAVGCSAGGSAEGGSGAGPVVASPAAASTAVPSPAAANTAAAGTPSAAATPTHAPVNLDELQLELALISDEATQPTGLTHAGDGSGRLFVLEKRGTIRIIRDRALIGAAFLDITDRVGSSGSEQGLLGIAFHPHYEENGFFYINYTDRSGDTVIARYSAPDGDQADPNSEHVLLRQDQPASNHNGGALAFGPDGYLYIGLGDGGLANDAFGNGQNGQSWLAKILRIDVDGGDPYAIPPDNPFVGEDGFADEIWAYGLRNPWRFSFDRATGDLYIGDVGQGAYEEIDFQPAGSEGGENYGWPIMEGMHCFRSDSCEQEGLTLPIVEYDHGSGCSVTGGYVYRGEAFPSLAGVYFFGDYCSGLIWGLAVDNGEWQVAQLLDAGIQLSSFGEDESGELYVTDLGGAVYQISAPTD
jgi:glucose/arabinose dehydrogenase